MKARWSLWASLVLGLSALPAAAQQERPGQEQQPQGQQTEEQEGRQQQQSAEGEHAGAQKQEVKLDQLPKAAQQAIQSNLGGGKIEKIEKVTMPDGQVQYSARFEREGRDHKLVVDENGKVLRKDEGKAQ